MSDELRIFRMRGLSESVGESLDANTESLSRAKDAHNYVALTTKTWLAALVLSTVIIVTVLHTLIKTFKLLNVELLKNAK